MSNIRKELEALPALYSYEDEHGNETVRFEDKRSVHVFGGPATWILTEYDPTTGRAYGLCDLGMGFPELGYVMVQELESVRIGGFMPLEVDKSLTVAGSSMSLMDFSL